jgi:hypothetical protein
MDALFLIVLISFLGTTGAINRAQYASTHAFPSPLCSVLLLIRNFIVHFRCFSGTTGSINRAPTFSRNKLPDDMPIKCIRSKIASSSSGEKRAIYLRQLPDLSGEDVGARFIAPVKFATHPPKPSLRLSGEEVGARLGFLTNTSGDIWWGMTGAINCSQYASTHTFPSSLCSVLPHSSEILVR